MPLSHELSQSLRQFVDKLVPQVKPVIHAIVAYERLFSLNNGLHNETKAHFPKEKVLFGGDWVNLLIQSGFLLFLFFRFRLVYRRPLQLLTTQHSKVKVRNCEETVASGVGDNTIAIFQL